MTTNLRRIREACPRVPWAWHKFHVKFDDGDHSLFLNIRKEGDATWSRATPELARSWVARWKKEDVEKMGRNFGNKALSVSSDLSGFVRGSSDLSLIHI